MRLAVGVAEDAAGFDAAAGEQDRIVVLPVIAAGVFIDPRRAAEFAHHQQQRPLGHAALVHVVEQCRKTAIERRQKSMFQFAEVVLVRVPGVLRNLAVEAGADGDELDARLDQAACQQAGLAEGIAAVAFAQGGRLAAEIKGLPHGRAGEQLDRALLIRGQTAGFRHAFHRFGLMIDQLQQCGTIFKACRRNIRGQAQFSDIEIRFARIFENRQRIILPAEKAGELAGREVADIAGQLRQLHEARHRVLTRRILRHD